MFGTNEVSGVFRRDDGGLLVNSIWHTIQGEGPDAGRPAVFIRLSKCNLRCFFCDTEFERGDWMMLEDLVNAVGSMLDNHPKTELVVITGGEPFLQNILPLIRFINNRYREVSVETAGTVYLDHMESVFNNETGDIDFLNRIVCSPKTPIVNKRLAALVSAWKYIIDVDATDPDDGLPILSTQKEGAPSRIFRPEGMYASGAGFNAPIFVQPMDVSDPARRRANMIHTGRIAMQYGYRASIQTHKLLEVE